MDCTSERLKDAVREVNDKQADKISIKFFSDDKSQDYMESVVSMCENLIRGVFQATEQGRATNSLEHLADEAGDLRFFKL